METIDERTDTEIMLDTVCPGSEQVKYSGSDYDRLLAFLTEHKPEIMSQMAIEDDSIGCDPKYFLTGLKAFMDLPDDRFVELMNYVARNQDFLLSQLDREERFAPVPTIDDRLVGQLNNLLQNIHAYSNENGHRWTAKLNRELQGLYDVSHSDYYTRRITNGK